MVKVFTSIDSKANSANVDQKQMSEERFEQGLKSSLQNLRRDPKQSTIDTILNYSIRMSK